MNPWDSIKQKLEGLLSTESFQNWFSRTRFHSLDGSLLRVTVPDAQTKRWLESEYAEQVTAAARSLGLPARTVEYELTAAGVAASAAATDEASFNDHDTQVAHFSAKFTFDNYVVGASNQFAHAAAKSVATSPARSYNPLFIYGGTGMERLISCKPLGVRSLPIARCASFIPPANASRMKW